MTEDDRRKLAEIETWWSKPAPYSREKQAASDIAWLIAALRASEAREARLREAALNLRASASPYFTDETQALVLQQLDAALKDTQP